VSCLEIDGLVLERFADALSHKVGRNSDGCGCGAFFEELQQGSCFGGARMLFEIIFPRKETFGVGLRSRACRMLATEAPTAARRPLSRGIP
jgi:hypothetical protein